MFDILDFVALRHVLLAIFAFGGVSFLLGFGWVYGYTLARRLLGGPDDPRTTEIYVGNPDTITIKKE